MGKDRGGPARVLDARGALVLPGLVQAHVHLCQTLFRGMADDLPLLEWLERRIWPMEAAHDARSLRASARLGLAEMLLAGTSTILDMGTVHEHDIVFEAMAESGIRGLSGKAMMDRGQRLPRRLKESTRGSLEQSEALARRWHGAAEGRLGYAYAPRFILSCSERLVRGAVSRASEIGALVHTHAAEHAAERRAVREALGAEDVDLLARWGAQGPRTILAHGVQLRVPEMRRLASAGTRIVHCPSANLKLASGIAPIRRMRALGLVVGLGADGAPCNNRMDPWTEMRSASLLAKALETDAGALPALEALELATIEGARVLGLDDRIGSLEVGKRADLIVVDAQGLHALPGLPGGRPEGGLVYSSTPSDVRHVVIDGRPIVQHGELLTMDLETVRAEARREARKLLLRADL
ncbi:MAG: amidohydrolase family protein [Myxococcales bacterium]|nr:amidohydrolase family protein [Myxococcales bacterium]